MCNHFSNAVYSLRGQEKLGKINNGQQQAQIAQFTLLLPGDKTTHQESLSPNQYERNVEANRNVNVA
jgi:hypothetical protein